MQQCKENYQEILMELYVLGLMRHNLQIIIINLVMKSWLFLLQNDKTFCDLPTDGTPAPHNA